MDLKQCDIKDCGALMEPNKAHQVNILGKVYDLCDQCYQQIKEWVESTLIGGQEIVVSIPPADVTSDINLSEAIQEYIKGNPGQWQLNYGQSYHPTIWDGQSTAKSPYSWQSYTNQTPKGPAWKPGDGASIIFPFVK